MAVTRSAAPAKRFLDIEDALQWAYRDELPKRAHGGSFTGSISPGFHIAPPTRIEDEPFGRVGRPPGFPAALGDPHPDAERIEAAVNGLVAWAGHHFSDDDMADVTSGIPLAWRRCEEQDCHGDMRCGIPQPIDAAALAVEAIANMGGMVTANARMASRPAWRNETPAPHWIDRRGRVSHGCIGPNGKEKVLIDEIFIQVIDRRGRVTYEPCYGPLPEAAIFYREPMPTTHIRKDLYREGAYCPLIWRPNPARLLAERAAYCAWHAGLTILGAELSGQLVAIAVLAPAAAWAPWLGADDIHGRLPQLFAGLRQEPYHRETREQAAAKRQAAKRRAEREVRAEATRPTPPAGGRRIKGPGAA